MSKWTMLHRSTFQALVVWNKQQKSKKRDIRNRTSYLLRMTTHGMPIIFAAETPGWLPATSTQFFTGFPMCSAAARNATTIFSNLEKVKKKMRRHRLSCQGMELDFFVERNRKSNLSEEVVSISTLSFSIDATSSAILCFSADASQTKIKRMRYLLQLQGRS